MDKHELTINNMLDKLNFFTEQYFIEFENDNEKAEYYEAEILKTMTTIKLFGYVFISDFYNYITKKIKELEQINSKIKNKSLLNSPLRVMQMKYRVLLIKNDLQNHLATYIPGLNYTLSKNKRVIFFEPTLCIITIIKNIVYKEFEID